VGDARPDGGDAGGRRSRIRNRRQHRLGAVADRGDLHALHYHKVDVLRAPEDLEDCGRSAKLDDRYCSVPVATCDRNWTPEKSSTRARQ
jgi:hypothetical protein